ncbi:MAG: twin-arginine translocase subunit TatC [Dysgonamonadaceae bacterium]|jgi:sec-independent protein translocase protein TatC|nr:twin-arginine translocase subunit TatC [Dysgonamonadaceae bacterium]
MSVQEMSFWDHLEELRWMLLRVIIAVFVFAIAGFVFMPWLFDNVVLWPAKSDFFLYRYMCALSNRIPFLPDFCGENLAIDMINIDLTAQFFRHLSTSCWFAVVLVCPYILFEVWRFITPALYEHEKKNVRWVFLLGSIMFFIGCGVGYAVIFPMTLRFLYSYSLSDVIHNQISLSSYMDNFLTLILIMGFVFEMPLISWLFSQIGLLKKSFFKKYRRYAILILLIAAAVITPSGDPFTLALVFFPLYALYELSVFFVKADEKE